MSVLRDVLEYKIKHLICEQTRDNKTIHIVSWEAWVH